MLFVKQRILKQLNLPPLGTQIEANDMRAILNAIEAAHQAVKLTGAKRVISSIKIAERLDASKTLEDAVGSVTEKLTR